MTIHVYWEERGAHVHCRVFAGKGAPPMTLALVGTLVFDSAEWPEAQDQLAKIATVRVDRLHEVEVHGTVDGRDG